jgi:hypothetical protein
MRTNLEDDLARTFRAAALAAPDPEPEFPAAVAARRRRRARTRMAGVAAAVVAVGVAAVGLAAVRPGDPAPTIGARPMATGSLPTVDLSAAEPYREVWPDALVELPFPLPDGRPYSVEAALGDGTYVVLPVDHRGAFALPVVLDARTGAVRELATVPASGYVTYDHAGISVTDHHIAWVVAAQETGGATYREVWSAPKDGGPAVRRARFGPDIAAGVTAAEVGGAFYVSVRPSDGVGTVYLILDGAQPQKVADSDGYVLRYGPWAQPHHVGPLDLQALGRQGAAGELATFWNVDTGERRTPRTLSGVTMIDCTPLACLGYAKRGFVSYGTDGSRPLRATGVTVDPARHYDAFFDSTGRFVQIRWSTPVSGAADADFVYLWDRKTNTVGRQVQNAAALGTGLIDLGQSGGTQYLLDLTRIR